MTSYERAKYDLWVAIARGRLAEYQLRVTTKRRLTDLASHALAAVLAFSLVLLVLTGAGLTTFDPRTPQRAAPPAPVDVQRRCFPPGTTVTTPHGRPLFEMCPDDLLEQQRRA